MRNLLALLVGFTSAYSCEYDYCTPTYLYSPFTDTPSSSVTGTASSSITSSGSSSSTSSESCYLTNTTEIINTNSTTEIYIPLIIFGSGFVLFILIFVIIYCSIQNKIAIILNSS